MPPTPARPDAGWTSTCLTRRPTATSAPRSTPCSARPTSAWAAASAARARTCTAAGGEPPASSATCCCRRSTPSGARRLDQPGRARLRLRAARRPAGRGLRRGDLLRAASRSTPRPPAVVHVCDDIACRAAGADELARRARATRSGRPASTPDGRAIWLASPVPRPVRARAGGARDRGGRVARRALDRARDRRRRRCRAWLATPREPDRAPIRRPAGRLGAAAAAPRRRRRSDEPRRLPRPRRLRRRCARALALGPRRASIREVTDVEARSAAAAPPSRPAASGRPSPRQPVRPHYLDLQRRRVRAGHVQGPRRSWRATRSRSSRR